jgi:Restriction endonuclease XhoI
MSFDSALPQRAPQLISGRPFVKEPSAKRPALSLGWLMLVEDAPGSRSPVRDSSPHFPVFPDFQGASYLDLERYNILCRKLAHERLYTTATIMASPRTAASTGEYLELSELTSLKTFITNFAGHIAAEAARNA